jgi:hypothetical protein
LDTTLEPVVVFIMRKKEKINPCKNNH